jgi:VanZ family protein
MSKNFDFIMLIAYCGLIFWLSNQERLPTPHLFDNEDKFHHFTAYAVMAGLAWRALKHLIRSKEALFVSSVVFCSLYGVSDEWHQSFVVGRQCSVLDWTADTLGAMTLSALLYWRQLKTPVLVSISSIEDNRR